VVGEPDEEKVKEEPQDHHKHQSKFFAAVDIAYWPFLFVTDLVMPTNKLPELAFVFIVILFFFSTEYILKVIDVLSVYINLSHIFVGITFLSWGASCVELINMTIAVHNNEL